MIRSIPLTLAALLPRALVSAARGIGDILRVTPLIRVCARLGYDVDVLIASDYAPVQGFVLMMATLYVFLNLAIDVVYGLVDPRVRHPAGPAHPLRGDGGVRALVGPGVPDLVGHRVAAGGELVGVVEQGALPDRETAIAQAAARSGDPITDGGGHVVGAHRL